MNREIKFRAWNTEMNHMVYPSLEFGREILFPCFYKRITNTETDKDGRVEQIIMEMVSVDHILQDPIFEVMQFTGLKDRKGIDIYEGDIVLANDKNAYGKEKKLIYKIEFIKGSFMCILIDKRYDSVYPKSMKNLPKIEVIGNIYETPELLNK